MHLLQLVWPTEVTPPLAQVWECFITIGSAEREAATAAAPCSYGCEIGTTAWATEQVAALLPGHVIAMWRSSYQAHVARRMSWRRRVCVGAGIGACAWRMVGGSSSTSCERWPSSRVLRRGNLYNSRSTRICRCRLISHSCSTCDENVGAATASRCVLRSMRMGQHHYHRSPAYCVGVCQHHHLSFSCRLRRGFANIERSVSR